MLEIDDVGVMIRGHTLLDGITLSFKPGETVAILGENGAGKTTLLRLMAGDRLEAGTRMSGEVRLAHRRIHEWPLAERACLRAVLPQRPDVSFAFTVREVVGFGRHVRSRGWNSAADSTIVDGALGLADVLHLAGREMTTLSGGERARAHLAAAFAQLWEMEHRHSRFLLLDEPTAALDLAHQHALLESARAFARHRCIGVVAILHDLNLAAMHADRLVILKAGRVLSQGKPAEVLEPATIAAGFNVAAAVIRHPLTDGILVATAADA